MSKYRRVVAREKKNLGAWNAKLSKIYAETYKTVDDDPLERFGSKKKKKKRQNNSHEQTKSQQETVEHVGEVPSQSYEARTPSDKPSTSPSNSR